MAQETEIGYRGQADATSAGSEYNINSFLIWQILNSISGAKLVKVMAVTNAGSVSPVGFVDVQPMVNQTDGYDNATPHGTVYHLPYFRLQGGENAVIIDPQVGDIGVAIVEDRDISSVKANKAQANPGSKRIFDLADGLYIGGFLNGTPQQYIAFSSAGIDVVSPARIHLQAPNVEIDAPTSFQVNSPQSTFSARVTIGGLLTYLAGLAGTGIAMMNNKRVDETHTHGGVERGGSNTDKVT